MIRTEAGGNSGGVRKRLLDMSINALIGYIIVEISALSARLLGLTSIKYGDLFMLIGAVNIGTLIFIGIIYKMDEMSPRTGRMFFFGEAALFVVMFSMAVLKLNEFRIIGLIFALVAVGIELPFTNFMESLVISLGAVAAQIGVSFYATYFAEQGGSFVRELFYTICILPVVFIIAYVARQINGQKAVIESDKHMLEEMNEVLRQANSQLEITRDVAGIEMELATQIQVSYLPPVPQGLRDWDIALCYIPKSGVSGDFYDFYFKDEQLKGLSIFDVSGHGVSSALLTMVVKPAVFRSFNRMEQHSLGRIINNVNDHISREIAHLDNYITGILLRFNGATAEYVNAGHTDLLVKKSGTGGVRVIESKEVRFKGEPIGLCRDNVSCKTIQFAIETGDTLLLYTDCILESTGDGNERYGRDRLIASLDRAPGSSAQDVLSSVMGDFRSFLDERGIKDDLTLIVARKTA